VTFAGFPLYFSMNLYGLHCLLVIHVALQVNKWCGFIFK